MVWEEGNENHDMTRVKWVDKDGRKEGEWVGWMGGWMKGVCTLR